MTEEAGHLFICYLHWLFKYILFFHQGICGLFIKRNYSLAQICTVHSFETQVCDKLPWNSTQRGSLHSKITLHSKRHQPSSSPQNLLRNHHFCRHLHVPSFLVQPQQAYRQLATPGDTPNAPAAGNCRRLARRLHS